MPRRIADYPDAFAGWNFVSSIGAFISYGSTLFFVFIVFHTFFAGRRVGANYWGEGATTLEWPLSSPPPFHSYEEGPVIAPATHYGGPAPPRERNALDCPRFLRPRRG